MRLPKGREKFDITRDECVSSNACPGKTAIFITAIPATVEKRRWQVLYHIVRHPGLI
jgi:hypothetical protein